jgi:hypothetical protein
MKSADTLPSTIQGKSEEYEDSLPPVEKSLYSLDKITRILSSYSRIILVVTFINLILSIIVLLQVNYYSSKNYSSGDSFTVSFTLFFCYISSLLILGALYLYESTRKRGEVLFEEISDELEWYVDKSVNKTSSIRPEIDARISLRSFVKTTDLPFVSGKSGPAFYLILNIVLIIISTLYFTKLK